jgi:hypothetical protein
MNQIFAIKPYLWNGTWVFDDANVGLFREALVSGMPELIRLATQEAGIENPEAGFVALFSRDPFPGASVELEWVREESGGNTYRWRDQEGWLCPALFRYFQGAPRRLYVQVRAADTAAGTFAEWFAAMEGQIGAVLARLPGMASVPAGQAVRAWLRDFAEQAWQAGAASARSRPVGV